MPEIKLKNCPFCGSEAQFKNISNVCGDQSVTFGFEISCAKCGVSLPKRYRVEFRLSKSGAIKTIMDHRTNAVEAWNRRANDLIEMPCKVGDTVYVCYESPYGVLETTIDKIIIHQKHTQIVFTNRSEFTVWDNDWNTYKKSVFFTRDEAEKALEEHKNETD